MQVDLPREGGQVQILRPPICCQGARYANSERLTKRGGEGETGGSLDRFSEPGKIPRTYRPPPPMLALEIRSAGAARRCSVGKKHPSVVLLTMTGFPSTSICEWQGSVAGIARVDVALRTSFLLLVSSLLD